MTKHAPASSAHERIAAGKDRRAALSRESQAHLDPKARKFDPVALLRAAEKDRVRALLPVKYDRMKASPFAFFRGAVSLMAADLSRLPHSGLHVQLCGDAHVQNMGSFAAPDGTLVFDLNDFDETIRGPWEWDVKRMAASVVLAGRESGHSRAECAAAAEDCAESYCRSMAELARQPVLEAARHQVRRADRIKPVHAALRQSERARPLELLERWTAPDRHGHPRFRDQRPVLWRIAGKSAHDVLESITAYRDTLAPAAHHVFNLLHPLDVGFKVVGTGSVGLRDYVVLFEGNGPRDPIFLQIKQEVASAYAPYLPAPPDLHHGQRVAEGQRAIQPLSDMLLGWTTIGSHHYLVRQLNDHKGSIDLAALRGAGLNQLAILAGELLARGHARSGDACQISGYCGAGLKLRKALGAFAVAYANQAEADYQTFLAAIKRGKLRATAK